MLLTESKTIQEIQTEFSSLFPGLKIEFYSKAHKSFEGSKAQNQLDSALRLSDIAVGKEGPNLSVNKDMTVADLERSFEDRFGLHAQVFRRSANIWLQTTTTDGWTLELQNRKGVHSVEATADR